MGELFLKEQVMKQRGKDSDKEWSEEHKLRFEKLREETLEKAEEEIFFSPEKNNVVFASAIDMWSFTVRSFAPKIAAKFGMNAGALEKILWGKFYFIPSEKKVVKKPPSATSHEMFVTYIINPIVQQYRNIFDLDKLTNNTELKKCHLQIKEILYKWVPLERSMLSTVIESLPSPEEA